MTAVAIQSVEFGVYLRMDAHDVTAPDPEGAGVVNCQYSLAPWEVFEMSVPDADGAVTFASVSFPNVFLRMDGRGVGSDEPHGGTVNCQYGAGLSERFRVLDRADGTVVIESAQFTGVHLRMDGRGVTEEKPHGGIVNCHSEAGPWEVFRLVPQ